ncbi:MAG: hypothetical protein ABFD15_05615 [Methanofastidiosum sp.]
MKEIPREWRIAIFVVICTLLISVAFNWDYTKEKIGIEHSDVYLFAFNLDRTYSQEEIESLSPQCFSYEYVPIKIPENYKGNDPHFAVPVGKWDYGKNEDFLNIIIENMGNKTSKNIIIEIVFKNPSNIKNIETLNNSGIILISGGINASFAKFKLEELFPNEFQQVNIVYSGKEIDSIILWIENEKINSNEKILIYETYYKIC